MKKVNDRSLEKVRRTIDHLDQKIVIQSDDYENMCKYITASNISWKEKRDEVNIIRKDMLLHLNITPPVIVDGLRELRSVKNISNNMYHSFENKTNTFMDLYDNNCKSMIILFNAFLNQKSTDIRSNIIGKRLEEMRKTTIDLRAILNGRNVIEYNMPRGIRPAIIPTAPTPFVERGFGVGCVDYNVDGVDGVLGDLFFGDYIVDEAEKNI